MSNHALKDARGLSFKYAPMAVGDVTAEGVFEGYANTFNEVDLGNDITASGAFAETIMQRGAQRMKMLYEHDPRCPVGVWEDMREDAKGLWVRGRLLVNELEKAREVYALLKNRIIDGLSIGYRAVKASRHVDTGARLLEVIDLREISLVMFPMNETSLISSVKGELPTEREFERWLMQDAGLTRSQARTVITSGFKSLQQAKPGAGGEGASSGAIDWAALGRELDTLKATISD